MADTNTTINVMLFEAGALAQTLTGNTQTQALARKLEDAYGDALAAGNLAFDIALDPFEVGMAFGGAMNNSGLLSQKLSGKLRDALRAKLEELGIDYDGASSQPDQPSADNSTQEDQASPANDGQPADSGDTSGQDAL